MEWKTKPRVARFIRRYKRFFADVELDGKVEVAHVANTGSLKTVLEEGRDCLVCPSDNPERKLKWGLVALKSPEKGWIGIDTSVPNRLVQKVIEEKLNPDWKDFDGYQSEKKIDAATRLDGLFFKNQKPARYLEIKNVTLKSGSCAAFPDAVTERGLKHLRTLETLVRDGFEAELVFTVQRLDCEKFIPALEIDPEYSKALKQVMIAGVQVNAWTVRVTEDGCFWTGDRLPIEVQ